MRYSLATKVGAMALGLAGLVGCKGTYVPQHDRGVVMTSEEYGQRHDNPQRVFGPPTQDLDGLVRDTIELYRREIEPEVGRSYEGKVGNWERLLQPKVHQLREHTLTNLSREDREVLSSVFTNYAWVKNQRRDYTQAENLLDIAIGLDEDNAAAFFNRAYARKKQGRVNDCVEDLRRAAELEPENRLYTDTLRQFRSQTK